MAVPDRFEVKVVGLSFRPGYPDNVLALAEAFAALPPGAAGEATLVRDVDNAHDANAVAILAAGAHVGYLPAALAAKVAPEIDAGTRFLVTGAEVLIHPEHPERPGLLVQVQRIHTQGPERPQGGANTMSKYPWDQHKGAGDDRPPIWKADEAGKVVAGVVTRIWTYTKGEESTPVLHIDTGEHGVVSVWASQTVLRQGLAEQDPQVGDSVTIKYLGAKKLDNGNTLKEFDVAVQHSAPTGEPQDEGPF